ncbi:MAG TPA: hypothetical protein VKR22_12325 [Acidimicrobiales bacterium]|nr:hypothetical protein [Acidimicrobiales bacterium]
MTKPVEAETKVTDPGWNPDGTGPPAGPMGLGTVEVVVGEVAVDVVGLDSALVVVGAVEAEGPRGPEHDAKTIGTRKSHLAPTQRSGRGIVTI